MNQTITTNSKKHLLALAVGGFAIGLTEFVIMGLLPDVAQFFNLSIPETGGLISSYALGVVVGAPILTLLGGKLAPKKLLILLMLIFAVFNGLSALASQFQLLMILRFLSGLPHGAYFGVGSVVANQLAPKGKGAAAVASMFVGLTMANVLGVPFGTWLGSNYGWQWPFVLVSLISVLTMVLVYVLLPELPAKESKSIKEEFKIFKSFNLWLCIIITSIGFGGFFAWISYISPLLTDVSGFSKESIPFWMIVIGIGMTVGVTMGGKITVYLPPAPATLLFSTSLMICLILGNLLAHNQTIMAILVFITSALALAQCPPVQVLLIQNSEGAEMLGASLGQSSFNIGNSLGAILGGLPLFMGYSYRSPLLAGAGMSAIGILFTLILIQRLKQNSSHEKSISAATVGH